MNWYYKIAGGHTHVRVFMNKGLCGTLCFRNEEFAYVKLALETISKQGVMRIDFINETTEEIL